MTQVYNHNWIKVDMQDKAQWREITCREGHKYHTTKQGPMY